MYTVLIVEDNKEYRDDLAEMLELEGYGVLGAANGAVALSLMKQQIPNVIVADDKMPFMTGSELIQAVKADKQLQTIPFIMLTGSNQSEETLLGLGAEIVLLKPIEICELLSFLDKLLKA
jgi:CheY-like chemotaxis protein